MTWRWGIRGEYAMLTRLIKAAFRSAGIDVHRAPPYASSAEILTPNSISAEPRLQDQPDWVNEIIAFVSPYTMTSPERIATLCQAVEHVVRSEIEGDIVECGVWRGGSMMGAAMTLRRHERLRRLYLFDTFEGMPPPADIDVEAISGVSASHLMAHDEGVKAIASIEDVRNNISLTRYPMEFVELVAGKVELTIPQFIPKKIAVLRLDTDWYASTRHELVHLWPRLARGGILIIDDYGHWAGARKAVDEFVETLPTRLFLNRIDYTGRLIVKP
jgi:O-methyltransferase